MTSAARLPLAVGWYGKLPSRGDFVGRGLPKAWLRTWDDWLQRSLADASQRWGAAMREHLLDMPPWQGIVLPGQPGAPAWCAVVCASSDRVGRAFPMLLAESHDEAALNGSLLSAWRARGLELAAWLTQSMPLSSPKDFEAGAARWASTPWPESAECRGGAIAELRERWPAAGSFWWRAEPDADLLAPLVQSWPPRPTLVLDWLGEDDTAPG